MTTDNESFLRLMEAETLRKFNEAWTREEDPRVMEVLRGHLLVESVLDKVVTHEMADPDVLLGSFRGQFAKKLQLCRARFGTSSPAGSNIWYWKSAELLNEARNDAAHSLGSHKFDSKITAFLNHATNAGDCSPPVEMALPIAIAQLYAALTGFYAGLTDDLNIE